MGCVPSSLAADRKPGDWRRSFLADYYKELGDVPTCYAVRTTTHTLVKYPGHPEWTELFDLKADPDEVTNLVSDTELAGKLEDELSVVMKAVNYAEPKADKK
jgi:hypothetical protein